MSRHATPLPQPHTCRPPGRVSPSITVVCGLLLVVTVALVATSWNHGRASHPVPDVPSPITASQARALLASLPDGTPDFGVAYAREAFGPAWSDVDHNGCDTRDDILGRDLTQVRIVPGGHSCVVTVGVLDDPYTGQTLVFDKRMPTAVQIDHLVPLHAAWTLGAYRWSTEKRLAYANDPQVLLAVSGPANQDKSDALADRWRPPNRASWCAYAGRTIIVHTAYALPVTASERAALLELLDTCPL